MRNIFQIYKRDMINIVSNWATLIMIIVLIIIPSLYSLINIKASWDPYGSTKGLKVAIINDDKGTEFKGKDINLGDELVKKLKENDKLGWYFVDKDKAKKGLLEEKYYATIEIPENFSEDATTLTSKNIKKPKLIYTVNEKKNAIAPKITDTGVKTVRDKLDENVIKTVSGIMFRMCNEAGVDIQNNRPELRKIIDNIYKLDEDLPNIEVLLDNVIEGTDTISELIEKTDLMIPTVSDTIDATEGFLENNQNFSDDLQEQFTDMSPIIQDYLVKSEQSLDSLGLILENVDESILPEISKKTLSIVSDSTNATQKTIKYTKSELKSMKNFIDKISNIEIKQKENNKLANINKELKSLNTIKENLKSFSKRISSIIDKLDDISDKVSIVNQRANDEISKLENGERLDIQNITDIRKIVETTHDLTLSILENYNSDVMPSIENAFDSIKDISNNGFLVLEKSRETLPQLEKVLNDFNETTNLSNEQLNKLKDKFPDTKDKVHKLADKFKKLDDENKIDELLDMITNDWDNQSTFMASPVKIEDNRLFPWPNYGSTATPFYTTLCLWIGGLLGSALLSLNAKPFDEDKPFKAYEIYLGKLLLFLTIAIFQAIVASLGALFILGSYTIHPIMFVFYCIFVSIVFVTIIYTAASVFDNVGKAIIVVILVLQIAGTSGNFPIEVNPVFFQKIYEYLPFTYATNGMRQIMAGIVYPILIKDIVILIIYMVISLISGIVLKKAANSVTIKFIQKLNESKIMRH